ncbi:RNA-binding domain-containing protein [Piedraia hortae CBS 480.64]|uniref:RNA-binding domain-containing protein n=1 Tax=Piedraia hortae CBS 480.64 TaxID=1314780 RepID=A0A6A7C8B6_9PEZI|nr:RNA-binding domain-containing protein [Piedraia hortae CBS 480.64]
MADLDTYGDETRNYEERDYGSHSRNRSRSPDGDHSRQRDEPPSHRDDRLTASSGPPERPRESEDALNTGSNLFVTGIHPRLGEAEITRLFEKYGAVEKCNIMRDPHTRDSRGFGFVKMETAQEADAAKDALQGQVYEGRTLSIEKARRSRPRTPTPGKYYGPPKRGANWQHFGAPQR